MFDPDSRYAPLDTATHVTTDRDGRVREVRYVRRRFIPRHDAVTPLVEHTVVEGDRLDNVTARYLGDPLQFWRVCDVNHVLHPDELTDEIGRPIVITLPSL